MIGLMLGGGVLSAGISQAQEVGDQDARAERQAELIAAAGGPASGQHLVSFASDRAAVDVRDDDVAPAMTSAAPAATPVAMSSAPAEPTTDPSSPDDLRSVARADTTPAR